MALPLVGCQKPHGCWLHGWGYAYLGVVSIGVEQGGLLIVPWEIFLFHHATTVGVVWVVRPDLVFVLGRLMGKTICVSVLI